jgi:tRNA (5-methylaminomethyl-2-thiouridylate)-methyltransferase
MKRVLLGMSGGVDSSVAAYLLKQQGYEVVGVTIDLFDGNKEEGCTSSHAINDASKVCKLLDIEHYVVEYKCAFKKHVIDYFIKNYKEGKTPNPCIECNKYIKFGLLWKEAQKLNCDYIATGHYAKREGMYLKRIDSIKDQSYFLYQINKGVIPHILFPLSNYRNKEDVRAIAAQLNLVVKDKKDSQDICFIEEKDYKKFLQNNKVEAKEGNFILKDGRILGRHKGITNYTIGQRKGLGISYSIPLYVIKIDSLTNDIIVGGIDELYANEAIITDCNLLVDELPRFAKAKIRYKASFEECEIINLHNGDLKIVFTNKVKAVTPGQSLVLYDKDVVLGGGIIK